MNFNKTNTSNVIFVVGGIVLLCAIFAPFILTRHALCTDFVFGESTGWIGDTIGGITAPFMSLVGSILVFFAFIEQLKANNLVKEQFYFQHIESQITRLEEDFFKIKKIRKTIFADLSKSKLKKDSFYNQDGVQNYYEVDPNDIVTVIYVIRLFNRMFKQINKLQSEEHSVFLKGRLQDLFGIFYADSVLDISKKLDSIRDLDCNCKSFVMILINQVNELEKEINEK